MNESSPSKIPQRFRLADGLAFVAAVAVGLALVRLTGMLDFSLAPFTSATKRFVITARVYARLLGIVLVCLCGATFACAIIPRGSARRMRLRSPGTIVCLTVSVMVPMEASWYLALRFVGINHGYVPAYLLLPWQDRSALVVFVVWITLFLVGRWRTDPSWPDRLGRTLGRGFLVLEVVSRLLEAIIYAIR